METSTAAAKKPWTVRAVVKTYDWPKGIWGTSSIETVDVEADDENKATAEATRIVDEMKKDVDHRTTCTAVFPGGSKLLPFRADVSYDTNDEFDDNFVEGIGIRFDIHARDLEEANRIASAEARLHLGQYCYFKGVEVRPQ